MNVLPNLGGDRLTTTLAICADTTKPKRVTRTVRGEANVKIFGLSKIIEGVIKQQARDSYAKGAEFMNRWIREKGLSRARPCLRAARGAVLWTWHAVATLDEAPDHHVQRLGSQFALWHTRLGAAAWLPAR
jgi:hypothetical protein